MKQGYSYLLFFALILISISSCNDDDFNSGNLGRGSANCDVDLGEFSLTADSRNSSSVEGFQELVYINELGEEKIFSVGVSEDLIDDGAFTEGDSTIFCYTVQSQSTVIASEDGIEYYLTIESKPYFPDVESMNNADVLKIFYNDSRNTEVDRRLVFRKVLDIKDYPAPLYTSTVSLGDKFFVDNTFKNVEITQFNSPIVRVYYNDLMGILAFEDEQKILWQLKERR